MESSKKSDRMPYFPHDYYARSDSKLVALQSAYGIVGLGLYWALIELLWENAGSIKNDINALAFELRLSDPEKEILKKIISEQSDLSKTDEEKIFVVTSKEIYSPTQRKRYAKRQEQRVKWTERGTKGAEIRWKKEKKENGDAEEGKKPKGRIKKEYSVDKNSDAYRLTVKLHGIINQNHPRQPIPKDGTKQFSDSVFEMDKLIRKGVPGGNKGFDPKEIEKLIDFVATDPGSGDFSWNKVILSVSKFRKQAVKIEAQSKNKKPVSSDRKERIEKLGL